MIVNLLAYAAPGMMPVRYTGGVGWFWQPGLDVLIIKANAAEFLTNYLRGRKSVWGKQEEASMFDQAREIGLTAYKLREVGHETGLYQLGVWRLPDDHPALEAIVSD